VIRQPEWNIPGDNPLAGWLREAARVVPAPVALTIATEAEHVTADAFVLGPVALQQGERLLPFYAAFEAVEEVKRALEAGVVGRIYGLFGSFRVERDTSGETLISSALLPIVALALDLLPGQVTRVWARRVSLFAADDAWFVTLRLADETIITLEAMASNASGSGRELLVEVTGSDLVLRAEPMRQSVVVESLERPASVHPWWEDLPERYLQLLASRAAAPQDGSGPRLRAVWTAMLRSAQSGVPQQLP
jgi:predicted dehydrogenase